VITVPAIEEATPARPRWWRRPRVALVFAVVLPVVALASDPLALGEFGFGTPLRLFLWVGFGLGAAVYVTWPRAGARWPWWGGPAAGVLGATGLALAVVGLPLCVVAAVLGPAMVGAVAMSIALGQLHAMTFWWTLLPMLLLAPLLAAPFYLGRAWRCFKVARAATGVVAPAMMGLVAFAAVFALPVASFRVADLPEVPVTIHPADAALIQRLRMPNAPSNGLDGDAAAEAAGYRGRGHGFVLSPDRHRLAFFRSHSDVPVPLLSLGGRHHVYLWDVESRRAKRVLELTEADPGSGQSFDIAWTADGTSLHLAGSGIIGRAINRELNLYYLVDEDRWVEIPAAPAR
jgi:hypothetical protein